MTSCAFWNSYIEIGATAYQSGHYAIAEKMVKAAIEETAQKDETFNDLLIELERLGDYLLNEGRYSNAERLYKRARSLQQKRCPENNPDACRILYKLVRLHVLDGRHAIARRTFAQAFLTTKKTKAVTSVEHEQYLAGISTLWIEKGKREEAMLVYNEMMAIKYARPQEEET